MPETDSYGHSEAKNLPVGLYLVVETRVPEMVTETTAPFLLSLPMTTVDGTQWVYDICVYPKNGTSNPVLTKTVRESKESTGKNGGTGMIDDGFDHAATASVGDAVEYQIISRLPAITSKASYLTTYTFEDTICKGMSAKDKYYKKAAWEFAPRQLFINHIAALTLPSSAIFPNSASVLYPSRCCFW